MAKRPLPAPEALRQLLEYHPETGHLYWLTRDVAWFTACVRLTAENKANAWNARNAGNRAFTASDGRGYFQGTILGYHTTAHRVIWALVYGEWPSIIDHIDGDGENNQLTNLREVTVQENCRNRSMSRANTSGIMGVRFQKKSGAWEAQIGNGDTYKFLGTYKSREEAIAARRAAEARHGYHPNHGKRPVAYAKA